MERGTNQNNERYKNQLNTKMKLNDTNLFIKDNLQNIIDGKFDDKFEPEQLKMMLEMSFLYNHITFDSNSILFNYNDINYKVTGITEIINSLPHNIDAESEIISIIKKSITFNSAYKQFLTITNRDKKINSILN